jgi:MFS transporter, DHA1 family, staphyloferrin A biosynthesis exporter
LEPVSEAAEAEANSPSRAPTSVNVRPSKASTLEAPNGTDRREVKDQDVPPAKGLTVVFSSLRHRDYRYLWTGTLCMSAGQWIQQVTLGWLLYDLTGSAVLLGVLNGVRSMPFLFLGPIAGVAADRMDRRKMLLVIQPLLAITTVVMGLLVASHLVQVWHLFVFTLITASLWSINQPVRQTLVPNLVPKRDLMNALALNSMAFNSMKVIGPAVGGLLIAMSGAADNFFVQGVVYSGLVVLIYLMKCPPTPPNARRESAFANLKEGLAYVWSTPLIFGLITLSLIPQMLSLPLTQALMPVFSKDVLGVGPDGLGLLLAAPGVGAVAATFVLAVQGERIKRKGVLMLGGLIMLGVFLILFSQSQAFPVALAMLVGVGGFQMIYMTTVQSVVQVVVPDHLRGRVMSIQMLNQGLGPGGALAAGLSTQLFGARFTVTAMGVLVIALTIAVACFIPRVRQIET